MGTKLQNEYLHIKKEITSQCAYSVITQNIEAVRQSVIRSPRWSARRHSVALGISDRSMRRILQKDLNFHPSKIVGGARIKQSWHGKQ
jgi:hypothetical protein